MKKIVIFNLLLFLFSGFVASTQEQEQVILPVDVFDKDGYVNFDFFLTKPDTAKFLELVPDQLKEIKSKKESYSNEFSELIQQTKVDGLSLDTKKFKKDSRRLTSQFHSQLNAILLPHQMQGLRDASTSYAFDRSVFAVVVKRMFESEGNQNFDIEKLTSKARKLEEEVESKTAELRRSAWQELLGELSGEQRKIAEEQFGITK